MQCNTLKMNQTHIKLTVLTTTLITWFIFCDLQHNASSWIIQWKVQKPSSPLALYTFSFNFSTTPAFFPVIDTPSVALLTARAQSTPTLSNAPTSEAKMFSAFITPVTGINWTNSSVKLASTPRMSKLSNICNVSTLIHNN